MIPLVKNKEFIDSLWLSERATVFFQMTASAKPSTNSHGLVDLLDELPANAKQNVCIVYVVPANDERTRNFKCQSIVHPTGMVADKCRAVEKYPQYVYYCDYKH